MLGDEGLDIVFGDSSADTGAGDFGQVDVIVFGHAANQRTGANPVLPDFVVFLDLALLLPLQTDLLALGKIGRNLLRRLRLFACGRLRRRARRCRGFHPRRPRTAEGLPARSCCGRCCSFFGDGANDGVDLDGVASLHLDVLQRAGGGRRYLGVNLVGGDFKQRLVALNFFSRLLQPLGDGSFKNRFPHLGHDDICWHIFLPRGLQLELEVAANF